MTNLLRNGLLILVVGLSGCRQDRPNEVYYPFADSTWHRFNILSFELPVEPAGHPRQVVFFARHNQDFPYPSLDFNMILNTPSGEERIREYHLMIRDESGNFLGSCNGGICEARKVIIREIYINKPGMLVVEVENLIPRMKTPGLLGIGIRLEELQ